MQKGLSEFVNSWKSKKEISGILLCGSYAVGLGTSVSDVDIRLILEEKQKFSIKGVQNIDGNSFSYLGRTKANIIKKFNSDFFNNSKIEVRNFTLGKILYENGGNISELKKVATNYWDIPFLDSLSEDDLKEMMYSLSNQYDYLKYIDSDSSYYFYNYILFLRLAIMFYSRFLKLELDFDTKLDRMLNDNEYIKNYKFKKFPDQEFIRIWKESLTFKTKNNLMKTYNHLVENMYNFDSQNFSMRWQD